MPIIQQITAGISPQGQAPTRNATASDFATEATANNGEGLITAGRALQGAADVLEQRAVQADVTNIRVKMAQARAQWDVAFQDQSIKAQPGEDFSGKFTAQVSDYMQKARDIAQTPTGQRTFDLLAADLSGHYAEKSALFQGHLAGVKAQQDWTTSLHAYGTALQTDPSSYGSVLAQAMTDIHDPNGAYAKIDVATRGKLEIQARNALAQNYVQGFINLKGNGPDLALNILNSGRLDSQLDPKVKETLIHQADLGMRRNQAELEHADALARKVEKDRIAATNDDLMGKFIGGKMTMNDVRNSGLPAFGEGSQHTWISMLKQQAKDWAEKPIKTVPSVMVDAFERINLPPGDPRKITNLSEINGLYASQRVSLADLEHLRKEFKDQMTDSGQKLGTVKQDFMKGMRPQLDKSSMNSMDAGGAERFSNFTVYVNTQLDNARKANQDPYELFNPQSSKYLGKAVPAFQSGPQTMQRDLAGKVNASMGKTAKRNPGESVDAYLARVSSK
ncbi:MAG: hypothetical protein V4641_13095 [Pseudomonadota bacterium]